MERKTCGHKIDIPSKTKTVIANHAFKLTMSNFQLDNRIRLKRNSKVVILRRLY